MDRREFLRSLAVLSAPPLLLHACAGARVSSSGAMSFESELLLLPMHGNLVVFNVESRQFRSIPIANFNPHSVIINPARPREALVIDQVGATGTKTQISLVDIVAGTVKASCMPEEGLGFSGHGCISADGRHLFLCENFLENAYSENGKKIPGRVTVRDASTLAILKILPGHGAWAHNVMFLDEARLVVGFQGTKGRRGEPKSGGEIAVISAESGKLISQYFPSNPNWSLNHFDLTDGKGVVISAQTTYSAFSKEHPGTMTEVDLSAPIIFGNVDRDDWAYRAPDEIQSKMLRNHTLVVDRKRNRALVAHQLGGLVSFWDIGEKKLLSTLSILHPQGISLMPKGDSYVVVTKEKTILFVDANTLKISKSFSGEQLPMPPVEGPLHIASIAGV
ncbi:MAG: DUF1513 domain-containing protein [Bdellovibrionota bacterium]